MRLSARKSFYAERPTDEPADRGGFPEKKGAKQALSFIRDIIQRFQQNPGDALIYLLMSAVSILTCLIVHEVAHGWVALKCGDPTAKMMGRLTLDPRKHLDPIGTVCMLFLRIGWAKPVPINPANFRNYRRDFILVSLAGIAANLLMFLTGSVIMILLYKHTTDDWIGYLIRFLQMFVTMNLSLAVFNLLPVPPLDGFRFLNMFLYKGQLRLSPQTMQIIQIGFLILCFTGVLNGLMSTIISGIYNAVIPFLLRIL